uniref:Phorbol-ester/DAG-type domain-containing protein n=1 Tax=Labrus bergylta TaxID=56723 RepID=A0A3Q3N9X9_9LABR
MSWEEFIELRDLRTGREQIELTGSRSPCSPPRLERTNALRISPGKVPDLLSRVGIIRGHNFQPCSHAQPTWCDLCGDFIWGLYKQSLRCVSESVYVGCACVCV